jgi:hypothetical protein
MKKYPCECWASMAMHPMENAIHNFVIASYFPTASTVRGSCCGLVAWQPETNHSVSPPFLVLYLLTFACYGSHLPGDARGSFDHVRRGEHCRLAPNPGLELTIAEI